jgi:hypothetical protein
VEDHSSHGRFSFSDVAVCEDDLGFGVHLHKFLSEENVGGILDDLD